jgi:hypothetical protein
MAVLYDLVRRKSLIDDLHDDSDDGPAICFPNSDLRKMLRLAGAGPKDVLFDFGSGWGQTLIVALTEFDVKRVVGFETTLGRYRTAKERLERWSSKRDDVTRDRWSLVRANFFGVLEKKKKRAVLADATIIFFGLETDKWTLDRIVKAWKGLPGNRRLLYYYNCLFPEIIPDEVNYPFCVSRFPFKAPKSAQSWLSKVTGKTRSSLVKGQLPNEDELWDELRHDYRVCSSAPIDETIADYKRRLKQAVRSL